MPDPQSLLARFAPEVQAAFTRFQTSRDSNDLQIVVQAALLDFMPKRISSQLPKQLEPEQRLIEDLGFDSLSMSEIVFFFEDLLEMRIENEELLSLRTVGDLQAFIGRKLAPASVG